VIWILDVFEIGKVLINVISFSQCAVQARSPMKEVKKISCKISAFRCKFYLELHLLVKAWRFVR
jgi:hypothetical protein